MIGHPGARFGGGQHWQERRRGIERIDAGLDVQWGGRQEVAIIVGDQLFAALEDATWQINNPVAEPSCHAVGKSTSPGGVCLWSQRDEFPGWAGRNRSRPGCREPWPQRQGFQRAVWSWFARNRSGSIPTEVLKPTRPCCVLQARFGRGQDGFSVGRCESRMAARSWRHLCRTCPEWLASRVEVKPELVVLPHKWIAPQVVKHFHPRDRA